MNNNYRYETELDDYIYAITSTLLETLCPLWGYIGFRWLAYATLRIYVGGGYDSINKQYALEGNPAPAGAYNEENNTWSVVEQKHIPPNKLSAVEIEGKVFFIINKFPVDSATGILPGELYPVQTRASESVSVQFSFL